MSLRVLVVDDHPMFRRGLAGLLESLPDVEVTGLAGSGEEAVELAGAEPPDVVLMDLNLPTISGVEATRRLGDLPDPPAVLALTMLDDDATVVAAMRAGARGYVLKGASGEEIAAAVRTVATGGVVLGAGVAGHLLALTDAGPRRATGPDALTDRERDVLELLADGLANPQIARRLGLSVTKRAVLVRALRLWSFLRQGCAPGRGLHRRAGGTPDQVDLGVIRLVPACVVSTFATRLTAIQVNRTVIPRRLVGDELAATGV